MKDITCYPNISIFADVDVEKTTIAEIILKLIGKIYKIGEVYEDVTITNYKKN